MPDDDSAASIAAPPRLADTSISRQVTFWGFASLVVLAVAFYVWWGVSFGVWLDNGVYAVTITLLLFGLAGMWLMLPNPPAPVAPPR